MDMEKMIVVKKTTKWWMTAVASASLAVGAIGGYGIGALTQKSSQQSSVQATTMLQQNKQDGKMPSQGGQPPQGQGQGNENGMPPQMGGQNGQDGQGVPGGGGQPPQGNDHPGGPKEGNQSKKKPSNADGTTKDDKNSENNSKTTNS
mgnify:CR=1 FL=1